MRGRLGEQIPVLLDQGQQRLGLYRTHRVAQPGGAAEQHHPADLLRVIGGEGDRRRGRVVVPEQRGCRDAGRGHHRVQVAQVRVQSQIGGVHPAVRAAVAAAVVEHERHGPGEFEVGRAQHWYPPLREQAAQRRQPDERRSMSEHLIGQHHPIAGARIVQRRSGLHPCSIRHRPGPPENPCAVSGLGRSVGRADLVGALVVLHGDRHAAVGARHLQRALE